MLTYIPVSFLFSFTNFVHGWPWSSRLPTCETCFVRRAFICMRWPFKLELTSCSP